MFPFVWRMVRPWLDPVVARKIHILGSYDEWQPCLVSQIGVPNLPACYGGTAPDLDLSTHPYAAIVNDAITILQEEQGRDLGRCGSIMRRVQIESLISGNKGVVNRPDDFDPSSSSEDEKDQDSPHGKKSHWVGASEDQRSRELDSLSLSSLLYHPDSPYANQVSV
jgi:hypothetical protein